MRKGVGTAVFFEGDRSRLAVNVKNVNVAPRGRRHLHLWVLRSVKTPDYPLEEASDFGDFGNMNTIVGLAAYFKVSCVVWNKKTLRNASASQQVVEYIEDDDAQKVRERLWSMDEILTFAANDKPLIHIEWDGVNHYAALVGPQPVSIDPVVYQRLLQVPLVTRVKTPKPNHLVRAVHDDCP